MNWYVNTSKAYKLIQLTKFHNGNPKLKKFWTNLDQLPKIIKNIFFTKHTINWACQVDFPRPQVHCSPNPIPNDDMHHSNYAVLCPSSMLQQRIYNVPRCHQNLPNTLFPLIKFIESIWTQEIFKKIKIYKKGSDEDPLFTMIFLEIQRQFQNF